MNVHHFYHLYADGDWAAPVTEHFEALAHSGLADRFASVHVGYVGTPENVAAAKLTVEHYAPGHEACTEVERGWEQETLEPLWEFAQDNDGLISYAHTKGSSRSDPIDRPWRRSMEWYCYVDWRTPVAELVTGKFVAGCHWECGGPSSVPDYGTGGMFGGNYWWTHCELLRRNVPPGRKSRYAAEHWLGQLSEVMPLTAETICDLNPRSIDVKNLRNDW